MEARRAVPAPRYRWVILALMCSNLVYGTFLGISLGLLLPSMLQDIAMTPVQQGWLSSSLRMGMAVLSIPAAWWISRYNPRVVRTAATLASAFLVFGQALAPGYDALLAARTGYGLVTLANQPAGTLLTRQWFGDREIALVNGVVTFVIGVTEFGAAALTPYFVEIMGGWRRTLAMVGSWALISGLLWLSFARERITDEYRGRLAALERPPIWSVFRYRELWGVCAGILGGPAAWWAFGTFWPAYMQRTSDLPLTTIGFVFGLTSLGMAPAGLLYGYLASRFGIGRWILVWCGLSQAGFSLLLLLTDSFALLVFAGIMVGFSWGFVPIVTTVPYQLPGISPREVAVAASFVGSMFALGGTVGPVVAGALVELTDSTFLSLALMCLFPLSLCAIGLGLPGRRAALEAVAKEA